MLLIEFTMHMRKDFQMVHVLRLEVRQIQNNIVEHRFGFTILKLFLAIQARTVGELGSQLMHSDCEITSLQTALNEICF